MKKFLSSLLLALTVIVTTAPAHANNKCNLFDISKMVGADDITISGNTMTLNATNIYTRKTLHQIAPDLKVGDVAYLNFEGTTSRYYIWLQAGQSGGRWNRGSARTISQADLDGIVKVYCDEPGQTITNLSISTGAVLDSYVPYNPLCATCQGIVKNYESATGTVAQNGTPSPTNPIEPIFYQQGDMILRKVGNIADSYDATTGKITRRVGVKVLDQNEIPYLSSYYRPTDNYQFSSLPMVQGSELLSDSFEYKVASSSLSSQSYVTVMPSERYIRIFNTGIASASEMTQWLSAHPVTVYYVLETPVEETVTQTTYCADTIKIATTAYNAARFSPVVTDLNSAVGTIREIVTKTINQTAAIASLQADKQTRPADACPAGKKCLLVETEENGVIVPHWFPIIEAPEE